MSDKLAPGSTRDFDEKTDKITVLYALLSPVGMEMEFAIRIIKPFTLARHTHEYIRVFDVELRLHPERVPAYLKNVALKKYREILDFSVSEKDREELVRTGRDWLFNINDAEMIECEFMVPKDKIKHD